MSSTAIALIAFVAVLSVIWLVVAANVWHFLHLKNAYFGGTAAMFICKNWLIPFRHFAETLSWHLPGGKMRKVAFIRYRIKHDLDGYTSGRTQAWLHREVWDKRLYHECAHDTLERPIDFIRMHAAIAFWPLILIGLGALMSFEGGRNYLFESGIVNELL